MRYTFAESIGIQEMQLLIKLYKVSPMSEQKVDAPWLYKKTSRHFSNKKSAEIPRLC